MAAVAVALEKSRSYAEPDLDAKVARLLAAAWQPAKNAHILVKPNLLLAQGLACPTPEIVAAVCKWLLDQGVKIKICDSPAFGTASHVANSIGLTTAIRPLGLKVTSFSGYRPLSVQLSDGKTVSVKVGLEALECDQILSVARVKAHSQMRITLTTKNCYGCIGGYRKAIGHARFGNDVSCFSDFVAGLWQALPPVAGFIDGIIAMDVTGPRNGKAFELGLIGASCSTAALDNAILAALGLASDNVPLAAALKLRGVDEKPVYTHLKPEDFSVTGFQVPSKLKNISFSPFVLARSMWKRFWLSWKR